jgi:hypothetical protein
MTELAQSETKKSGEARTCLACVLFVWMLAQMIALLIGASGIKLSVNFPQPPESMAMHEMLIAQIAVSSMLFPFLMRGWRTSISVIATSWPMLVLASIIAESERAALIAACGYLTTWLVVLVLWNKILQLHRLQLIGVAAAGFFSIGGTVMAYLISEFGRNVTIKAIGFSPVAAAIAQTDQSTRGFGGWIPLLTLLAAGLVGNLWMKLRT